MNRYATIALRHWQKHLPDRVQALTDPEEFFEELGEEIQQRVEELLEADRPTLGADYLQNLQNLNAAQHRAESQALQELALLPPDSEPSN